MSENDEDVESTTPNVADEKSIRKRKLTQKQLARQDDDWWTAALNSEVGRRCLWSLIDAAGSFEDRFACGPNGFPQPEATWFRAGEQAFGLKLYHKLLLRDPILVSAMHAENDPRFMKERK